MLLQLKKAGGRDTIADRLFTHGPASSKAVRDARARYTRGSHGRCLSWLVDFKVSQTNARDISINFFNTFF